LGDPPRPGPGRESDPITEPEYDENPFSAWPISGGKLHLLRVRVPAAAAAFERFAAAGIEDLSPAEWPAWIRLTGAIADSVPNAGRPTTSKKTSSGMACPVR
jgi:hypothetical protein